MLGYVGRITADKGIAELVVVDALAADRPLRCVLVGGEEGFDLAAELRSRPNAQRSVVVRPASRNVEEEYRAFISSSSLATVRVSHCLLEAQAMGIPCVTTTATGCAETIDIGRSGLAVPPRDVVGLREACAQVLDMSADERENMGRHGRSW